MALISYVGHCHCRAVGFSFQAPSIVDGMRCSCSICVRKGAVMSSFTLSPRELEVDDPSHALSTYRFGDGVAEHFFCGRCGVFTFVTTRLRPGEYRINLGCIMGLDSLALPVTVYDGAQL